MYTLYDSPVFFENYQKLRENKISVNNIIEIPTLISLLPNLENQRILDLGCGAGIHLCYYLSQKAKYIAGIDISCSMLSQATQNLAKAKANPTAFKLYHLAMEQLNEINEPPFDIITSSFAFHYVENFSLLLKHIYHKLKPQGTLVFSQEHPIVTSHKQGHRWEKDQSKQQIAYRLNHYREEGKRERKWFERTFNTYHRTISTIINQSIQTGFQIEQIAEPMLENEPEWHNEFKDLLHRPPLLLMKLKKT